MCWKLPELVEIDLETQARCRDEAIHEVKWSMAKRLPSEVGLPTQEEVLRNESVEVSKLQKEFELRERKRQRWKDVNVVPEGYTPPTSVAELKERISMGETYFANASLQSVDLSKFPGNEAVFSFKNAIFDRCIFEDSIFDKCDFSGSRFKQCSNFKGFSCQDGDFSSAIFEGKNHFDDSTRLTGADFHSADLRSVTGFVPDGNNLLLTKLNKSDIEADPWFKLRRKYNGLSLGLNGLLLLCFVIPLLLKMTGLIAYGSLIDKKYNVENWVESQSSSFDKKLDVAEGDAVETKKSVEYRPAIVVAFWSEKNSIILRIAGLLALTGFVLRYKVTFSIAKLREQEDRTFWTPRREDYKTLKCADLGLMMLQFPLFFFYVYLFFWFAFTKVPVW